MKIHSESNSQLTGIIREQTEILLKNLDDQIAAADLNVPIDGLPNWRYLFHTIHSLDKNFINPDNFTEPAVSVCGIEPDLAVIDENRPGYRQAAEVTVKREQLAAYASYVRQKIESYLSTLDDTMLAEKPDGCRFSRLTLIIGQSRHSMWHLGLSSGLTVQTGKQWPVYTGLFR
ncbi:MAG: hypothetical protein M0P01_06010 [Treponema sp.]|nr:hypothetical protein [Treponema sp.]